MQNIRANTAPQGGMAIVYLACAASGGIIGGLIGLALGWALWK